MCIYIYNNNDNNDNNDNTHITQSISQLIGIHEQNNCSRNIFSNLVTGMSKVVDINSNGNWTETVSQVMATWPMTPVPGSRLTVGQPWVLSPSP
jgi:hypothetical protein